MNGTELFRMTPPWFKRSVTKQCNEENGHPLRDHEHQRRACCHIHLRQAWQDLLFCTCSCLYI